MRRPASTDARACRQLFPEVRGERLPDQGRARVTDLTSDALWKPVAASRTEVKEHPLC